MIYKSTISRLINRFSKFSSYPISEIKLFSLVNKKRKISKGNVKILIENPSKSMPGKTYLIYDSSGFFPVSLKHIFFSEFKNINYYNLKYELHREEDKPASAAYFFKFSTMKKEGVIFEEYFLNGINYRKSGLPCFVFYNTKGFPKSETYLLSNGEYFTHSYEDSLESSESSFSDDIEFLQDGDEFFEQFE